MQKLTGLSMRTVSPSYDLGGARRGYGVTPWFEGVSLAVNVCLCFVVEAIEITRGMRDGRPLRYAARLKYRESLYWGLMAQCAVRAQSYQKVYKV